MGNSLRRYTDLPALTYMLTHRKITLLDPQSWDDSNDSHFLSIYKERNHLKSLLALCFTEADETYHHWKVFASGTAGVCIRFDMDVLLDALANKPGIRFGRVRYPTVVHLRSESPRMNDLPFIKRRAFRAEGEFRVIYESKTLLQPTLDVEIPLSCISRITLSPWAHKSLADPVKNLLKTIDGCAKLSVVRSTLVGNEEWKNIGSSVANHRQ